jgi:hypothetical protein
MHIPALSAAWPSRCNWLVLARRSDTPLSCGADVRSHAQRDAEPPQPPRTTAAPASGPFGPAATPTHSELSRSDTGRSSPLCGSN